MTNIKQQTKEKGATVAPFKEKGCKICIEWCSSCPIKGATVAHHTLPIHQLYTWEGWR